MREGKRHGFGILFYPADSATGASTADIEYEGMWSDDLLNGKAKRFTRTGQLVYDGDYQNGLKHGTGTSFKNGVLVYRGEYATGKKHGTGTLFGPGGETILEGNFVRGVLHGEARRGGELCQYRNGNLIVGALSESMNEDAVLDELSDDPD